MYAIKYFANGVQRFAGLILVTIVVFSGEDKGCAPLVFAIEIGLAISWSVRSEYPRGVVNGQSGT